MVKERDIGDVRQRYGLQAKMTRSPPTRLLGVDYSGTPTPPYRESMQLYSACAYLSCAESRWWRRPYDHACVPRRWQRDREVDTSSLCGNKKKTNVMSSIEGYHRGHRPFRGRYNVAAMQVEHVDNSSTGVALPMDRVVAMTEPHVLFFIMPFLFRTNSMVGDDPDRTKSASTFSDVSDEGLRCQKASHCQCLLLETFPTPNLQLPTFNSEPSPPNSQPQTSHLPTPISALPTPNSTSNSTSNLLHLSTQTV